MARLFGIAVLVLWLGTMSALDFLDLWFEDTVSQPLAEIQKI